ncbi:MAG TPA: CBS domain-containing protein [Tepidisphaeraceae bacterium]|nr:CBS domain-containing protein [Tepidisphaeraceae bacterium]
MPIVQDILNQKGGTVYSIEPDATVLEAVTKMNQHKLGALVVMEGDSVIGMFTERDVLRRVVGEERNSRQTYVSEVMTRELICCSPTTEMDDVSAIMQQQRIRHLPVCDDQNRLHGLISIGDVNACHASQQEAHLTFLNEYIYGRT